MTWTSLGPSNIGGCTLGVAIDFSSPNRLFAATSSGGCWRLEYDVVSVFFAQIVTTRWTPLTDQQPLLYTSAVASSRNHPTTVYYASGHVSLDFPAQVWRSDNGGRRWVLPNPQDFDFVNRIVVDPDDPMRLYLASRSGLWSSGNGGVDWHRMYSGWTWDVAMDPDDPSILYAGIRDVGLIKTTNARPSRPLGYPAYWRRILPWSFMPNPTMIRIGLGGQGGPNSRLVALKFATEVWTHPESGETLLDWQTRGFPGRSEGNAGQDIDWDHVIAVDPFDDAVILAGAQRLYRTNGEDAWTKVAGYGTPTHPDQQQVVFDPNQPGVAYLANDGGVWGSRDSGATWFDLSRGMVSAELFHTGISGGSAMADMYHEGWVGTTDIPSTDWNVFEVGMPFEWTGIFGDPKRAGRFFTFGDTLGLHRLVGTFVGALSSFDPNVGNFTPGSIDFDLRSGSNTIVVGTQDGRVMRALDGDSATPTWRAEPGIPRGTPIAGVAMVPGGQRRLFGPIRSWRDGIWAVDTFGQLYSKSDPNDNSKWDRRGRSAIGTRLLLMSRNVQGVAVPIKDEDQVKGLGVDAESSERIYLIRWNGIEMTPDGGSTWSVINGTGADSLPPFGLLSIFPHPARGSTLLVASSNGMYITMDGGLRWFLFGEGLPSAPISHAFMVNGTLFACSIGRGLWRRDVSGWGASRFVSLQSALRDGGPHRILP